MRLTAGFRRYARTCTGVRWVVPHPAPRLPVFYPCHLKLF